MASRIYAHPPRCFRSKHAEARRRQKNSGARVGLGEPPAGTRRLYICFVINLHYAIVLYRAERFKMISHESLQRLCFERRSSKSLARRRLTLFHDRNFGYGALPASDRGGSAHRLRSGLWPRAADRRPVLGIGAVPPPAAPAGCQSPVSGTGLETRRLVREALPLNARPHAMLLARNKHRTKVSSYRGDLPVGEVVPLKPPTPP